MHAEDEPERRGGIQTRSAYCLTNVLVEGVPLFLRKCICCEEEPLWANLLDDKLDVLSEEVFQELGEGWSSHGIGCCQLIYAQVAVCA